MRDNHLVAVGRQRAAVRTSQLPHAPAVVKQTGPVVVDPRAGQVVLIGQVMVELHDHLIGRLRRAVGGREALVSYQRIRLRRVVFLVDCDDLLRDRADHVLRDHVSDEHCAGITRIEDRSRIDRIAMGVCAEHLARIEQRAEIPAQEV